MPAPTPKKPKAPAPKAPPPPVEPEYEDIDDAGEVQDDDGPADFQTEPKHEDVLTAGQELSQHTPESFEQFLRYVKSLEQANEEQMPEAPFIMFGEFVNPNKGTSWHITVRSTTHTGLFQRMADAVIHAKQHHGLIPKQEYIPGGTTAKASGKPAGSQSKQSNDSGTDTLNRLVVQKDKVLFHVGKFKYPFSDSRLKLDNGAEIIAGLFDDDLGWEADFFNYPGDYDQSDWGGEKLYVDWEKVGRYYNVVKVHT